MAKINGHTKKKMKLAKKATLHTTLAFILVTAIVLGMATSVFASTKETTASVEFSENPEVNKLELVTAPAFDFGDNELPSGGETITATAISNDLQISDTRGTFEGWLVTAKLSNFSTSEISDSMPGAYINLTDGEISRVGNGTSASPTLEDSISLISGAEDSTPIISAAANAGIGTWAINWINDNASLTVLDTPAKGINTATINWIVTAPASE